MTLRRLSIRTLAACFTLTALVLAICLSQKQEGLPQNSPDLATPEATLSALTLALRAGDEAALRRVTTAKGLQTLAPDPQMLPAYRKGYYQGIGENVHSLQRFIEKDGWSRMDASHVGTDVRWRGGSGRYTDRLLLQQTRAGWKLDEYTRLWDR